MTTAPLRRLAGVLVLALSFTLAACGGGGSGAASADNPYNLQQAGVLRAGTLTDAPPNVYLKDGKFTGYDNELLNAVAAKLGLRVEFVGTEFSSLLAQVKTRKFDIGSSSISITEARKQTVAFSNKYDFGFLGLNVPAGSDIKTFDQLAGKRVAVVQGTVQDDYATRTGLNPVRVPDYNAALNQLRSGTADAWITPAEIGEKTAADSGGKVEAVAKQLDPGGTAYAIAPDNPELLKAVNGALDEVIADGTWARLQQEFYPNRKIPKDFKPGSGNVAIGAAN
ncbi:ABC transporter substrate-binding protein [uncultured Friedmanniella sp.]|uniref:ABC transporter substrate-binding protein n=1 Tax=uncultured Friedmanniella sp. TaxID=335381 RepID=UPI0035CA7B8F